MKIVRMQTDDGERIVGLKVPDILVAKVLTSVKNMNMPEEKSEFEKDVHRVEFDFVPVVRGGSKLARENAAMLANGEDPLSAARKVKKEEEQGILNYQ